MEGEGRLAMPTNQVTFESELPQLVQDAYLCPSIVPSLVPVSTLSPSNVIRPLRKRVSKLVREQAPSSCC